MSGPRNGAAPSLGELGGHLAVRDEDQRSGQDGAVQRALHEATRLAARGYVLVPVTIRRGDDGKKRPTFHAGWRDGGSTDPAQLRDWSAQHGCSFAVLCGPSGIEVVDLDLAENGPTWWTAAGYPVSDVVVDTPSGGQHHYWRRRPGGDPAARLVNNAGQVAPGVDARTVGGLVFAPGSFVVGEEGRPYAARSEVPEPHALQETPASVLALWRPARKATPASSGVPPLGNTPGPGAALARRYTPDEATAWVAREARDPLLAAEFGRNVNDTLNRAALVLGHFVPAFWPEDEARAMLRSWILDGPGARNGWHELDKADRDSIDSGLRRGMAEPYAVRTAPGSNPLPPVNGAPVPALSPGAAVLEDGPDSWAPVDLGPYLDGTVEPPRPSVGARRADGEHFLYAGLEHAVIGETEAGKSWWALAHVAAELLAGNRAVYVHFEESSPADTVARLVQHFRVPVDRVRADFLFIGPERRVSPGVIDRLCADRPPTLAVLDGQNEAMALHGQGINDPDGAAEFRRALVKPFTRHGVAVVALDHVVKNPDQKRSGYALGSVHKANGVTGAVFLLDNVEPFGKGRDGRSNIYVAKDRPGELRRLGRDADGRKAFLGQMLVSAAKGWALELRPPAVGDDGPDPEFERMRQDRAQGQRDEAVHAVAARLIGDGKSPSKTMVQSVAGGRRADVFAALDRLEAAGRLVNVSYGHGKVYGLPDDSTTGSR